MPKRILLIDDEDGAREITQFSLEATTDWQVLTAASGSAGLTLAASEHPDAILLDVMMPDMDGVTTFHHLQNNPVTRSIPVILLTAKATSVEHQPLMALGVAGIITKPFKIPTLIASIRSFLIWNE